MPRSSPVPLALLTAALLAPLAGLHAQQPPQLRDSDVVDRVVAVVGDSAVLMSQVLEEIERMRIQRPGFTVPTEPAQYEALFNTVRDEWVGRMIILQAAQKDTLVRPDEDRITEIVTGEIDRLTREIGGQAALQQALSAEGLTLGEYREALRTQVRQSQISQMYMQRRLQDAPPVEVTEDELLAAFREAQPQLQQRPKLITFEQVVIRPAATDSARAALQALADSLVDTLRAGADFAEIARTHSDDPGSAQNGGDLGWFRRGQMVEEFEDVAFALREDSISDPVETDFGFHIIQVQRFRSGEVNGRHILLAPEITQTDVARARDTAQAVAARAREGASMQELYEQHTDPGIAPDSLTLPVDQLADLPPGYESALRLATEGQILGPLEYQDGRGETRFAVVKVTRVREAGAYTLEDVRAQIAQQLQQQKQQERILSQLRDRTHIEVRPAFGS